MKKIVLTMMIAVIVFAACHIKILSSDKVNRDVLANREDRYLLIEVTRGLCINNRGDGMTIVNGKNYYVSYKAVPNCKSGNRYMTLFVYENDNGEDTIKYRFDILTGYTEP